MSFDKTAIEEANKHLEALSQRVKELNTTVNEQEEKRKDAEAEFQSQLNALSREKDAEIDNRDEQLRSAHEEIRKLKQELADKDAVIVMLSTKAAILDKATRYKMELQVLLKCLTDAEKLDSSDHVLDSNSLISVQNGSIRDDSSTDSSSSDEESPRMTQTNDIWTKPDTSSGDQRVRTYKIPGGAVKRLGQVGTSDSNNVGHTVDLDASIPSDKEVTLSRYESTL